MPIDTKSTTNVAVITKPHSPSATGTITGTVVDTAGFRSNTFIISAGLQTSTDITVVPVVLSGTVTSSLASAAADELIGTEPAANLSGTAGAISPTPNGYAGSDRYVRLDLIVLTASSGTYSTQLMQRDAIKSPV